MKTTLQKSILLIIGSLMASFTYSQINITGTVTDEGNEPLIGVNILNQNTASGTITDFDGNFEIHADRGDTLVFSYTGFATQRIGVDIQSQLNIIMSEGVSLDEVVVIGYGTQKKVSLTSAVNQIKGDELVRRPVSSVQQSLQGQSPGVAILDQGGSPGRPNIQMRIRGITTFSGNSDSNSSPLIIVDGVEQTMFNLNPEDIESVSVLKDASSTAIYGSRASNGVVLITTKRGASGKLQIKYDGYFAIQRAINTPESMGLEEYMRYEQLAYVNQGLAIPDRYSDETINTWVNSSNRELYPLPATWFQTVLSPAPQYSNGLVLSGGNEFMKTRVSGRYMRQKGIAPNYDGDIKEIRMSNDMNLSTRLTLSTDINYRSTYSLSPYASDVFNRFLHGTLFAYPKYDDGSYGLSQQNRNPLMLAEKSGSNKRTFNYLFINGKINYQITPELNFSAQISNVNENTLYRYYRNAYTNVDSLHGRTYTVANNSLTQGENRANEWTTNYLLNYGKIFGVHDFRMLFGFSELDHKGINWSSYRERFYSNDIQSLGQGADDATKNNSGNNFEYGLRSFFARINYSYRDKYLLEVNGRYDGSSRFTGDKQYSFFPSFSGAWRISQEDFFESMLGTVDELKLRGSWGQTGNQTVALYSYFASLSQGSYSFGGSAVPTYSQSNLTDPSLSWETNTQTDIGVDASLLNGRVNFTADWYKKRTTGILLALPVPAVTGFTSSNRNAGTMDNWGWEFSAGYRKANQKFGYNLSANLAINHNKVIDLNGGGPFINSNWDLNPRYIVKVGLPFNSFWGYQTDGYFQSQSEIDSYPTFAPNTQPGDVKYLDLNNDGVINSDDWTDLGNPFPKFTFGINTEFNFGNFGLNILFQGATGFKTRISGALSELGIYEGFTHKLVTDNYWTPERTDAMFPIPRKSDSRNVLNSDRMNIKGDYFRCKNLQLLYDVPKNSLMRANMTNARIYMSFTNLFTISALNKWNLDPETPSGRAVYYPQTALYTLGVNLGF